jgi:hypothetical protein
VRRRFGSGAKPAATDNRVLAEARPSFPPLPRGVRVRHRNSKLACKDFLEPVWHFGQHESGYMDFSRRPAPTVADRPRLVAGLQLFDAEAG